MNGRVYRMFEKGAKRLTIKFCAFIVLLKDNTVRKQFFAFLRELIVISIASFIPS